MVKETKVDESVTIPGFEIMQSDTSIKERFSSIISDEQKNRTPRAIDDSLGITFAK